MSIKFDKISKEAVLLDPQKGFEKKLLSLEIRTDPLTQGKARVVNYRFKMPSKPDLSQLIEGSKEGCPFCPQNLEGLTPKFPEELIPEGRIRVGETVLFPNSMPYDKHSAVVSLSYNHFIEMDQFSEELLVDGLLACQIYLKRLSEYDPLIQYFSVNWNYMPSAGGGLIHPHLQVVAADTPTHHQRELIEASKPYYQRNSRNFWADLVSEEERLKERYIGTTGRISWIASFVPKGMMHDVMAIFHKKDSFLDLSLQELSDFCQGLKRVLRYLWDQNFYSFNLALYSGLKGSEHYFWLNSRIVSRFTLPPIGTSDVNYFEKLHNEIFIVKTPESVCEELKEYFG